MTQERILEAVFKKQSDAIQQVLRRTCIVDFGVITEVLGENVVKVGIAVADSIEDVQIIVCTLISPCSATMALNIEPSVGDKVLVFFPRHFSSSMFKVTESDPAPIIDSACQSYSRLGGLAVLMNQFDYDKHHSSLQLSADGSVDLTINKGKATVKIDRNGNVEVNSQGKYTIKNSSTDLLTVISDLNTILKNLKTEGTQSAQTISSATVGLLNEWENGELKSLLNVPPVAP